MDRPHRNTYLSLFSGCGGLDLGFERAGFRGLLGVDIDPIALGVLEANIGSPIAQIDLSKEIPHLPSADVLLAGSPCQGFSAAGFRRLDDPRNSLLLVAPAVAAMLKPKVVVAENVPGAMNGAHKAYWDRLHHDLRLGGYQTCDLVIDSSDHGVPQRRKRIFLVGWNTGHIAEPTLPIKPRLVLRDALDRIDGTPNHMPNHLAFSSADYKIACRIGTGQKLTNSRGGDSAIHTWDIPEVFGRTNKSERTVLESVLKLRRTERRRTFGDADPVSVDRLKREFGEVVVASLVRKKFLIKDGRYVDLTHTFNGKYRRQAMTLPSRTVDTRFGDPQLFLHPTEHRAFTVREAARVQGFGDDFIFSGQVKQQFRMIGNAVPPPVAHSVAAFVQTLI